MKPGAGILGFVSVLVSLGFLVSGFSIGVDPRSSILLALLSMTFPLWILLMLAMTLIALALRAKRSVAILVVGWVIGFYNVFSFCPWNISREPAETEFAVKVMTYNVYYFNNDDAPADAEYNFTVSSIINSGADIVALQEARTLDTAVPSLKITQQQCDSVMMLYPYRHTDGHGQALLSKFSFETVQLPELPDGAAYFAAYRISLPTGDVSLVNVHLQSFRLNNAERQVYYEITDGEMSKKLLKEARHELIPKVKSALISHAYEAEMLVKDINDCFPKGPLLVCGDFNDILGSYPMKILCRECDLRDAFRDGAFGPTYTYHGSRFYFNIDHILYRGMPRPLSTRRLKVKSSDHYPLITTFSMGRNEYIEN